MRRRIAITVIAAALLVAVAFDATRLVQVLRYHQALANGGASATAADAPAAQQFIRAHAAVLDNRPQDALQPYQTAARDPGYAVAAQYNLGNLHLREAFALAERNELQHQPQSIELAKRHFRAALRADPQHWPSRYNLEQALHLAPERPDDSAALPGHAADRAVTSLRGFTLGLP